MDFLGKTFKSRATWLIGIMLGIPLVLILASILIPGCLHRLSNQ